MKKIFIMVMMLLMVSSALSAVENPILKVSIAKTDPLIVESDNYFDLWVKVDNLGNADANNAVVEFVDNYPFAVENDKVEVIGLLGSQNDYVVQYKVRVDSNAIEGNNILKIRYSVDGKIFSEKEFNIMVEDNSASLVIGSIKSSPLNLIADTKDAKLTINLQNIGESKAKLISAKIILPNGFESSNSFSDIASIASIDADDSADADFYIDIDENISQGVYPATLIVSYKEDNNADYFSKTLDINLPVKASPSFEITNVEFDTDITQKAIVSMIVTLKNIGGKDAESVSLRAFENAGLPIEFDEKSNFIGTIKSGESGQAVLKFTVDKEAVLKNYLLDLEIRAVSNSEVIVFDKTTSFDIVNAKNSSKTKYLLVGAVLIGLAGYFYTRKTKK